MKAKVIMDDREWDVYKAIFLVALENHVPRVPPSFPVIVLSELKSGGSPAWRDYVEHSFIEANDLRRLLSLDQIP